MRSPSRLVASSIGAAVLFTAAPRSRWPTKLARIVWAVWTLGRRLRRVINQPPRLLSAGTNDMAPRADRHRTRPIAAPAPDADSTCGPRVCDFPMVARRLASPHRGRIYDCSRFDATPRRPRQHAALEENHADRRPCRKACGVRATAAGGASSRASAAPPLRCGPAGDPRPAAVDGQLWPETHFRPGTDRHRPPPVPRLPRSTDRFRWSTWRSPYTGC